MSSGRREGLSLGCLSGFIVAHSSVDLIADPPAKSPDGLGLGVALSQSVIVGSTQASESDLGDGNPMEHDVELAIASTAQSMVGLLARPDRHGSGTVVAGKCGSAAEAAHASCLTDQLGGR